MCSYIDSFFECVLMCFSVPVVGHISPTDASFNGGTIPEPPHDGSSIGRAAEISVHLLNKASLMLPSGKRLQFANWKMVIMVIEIVDLTIKHGDFLSNVSLPEVKSA